ncbi:CCR4-NOT transcription complex subunit 4-like [Teleopsis dalmanni]|uniref:CCR4-NOT transcription complex subunit 4-like n=1 Tax=Teleopsis dalmanni TaxID=139649 RepID=UPI0018CF11A6|nr:CCR4-NOT transcription complex subunit 4-like [Teleopsis dalmanni]XP_037931951.1 CCR4-NOT transcription complex subunit 4-like [Teleopsis dalmanni]
MLKSKKGKLKRNAKKTGGIRIDPNREVECPLCLEKLEIDDLQFFPCECGYQICRFCWHRIRTEENALCPACRNVYPENPANFTPISQKELVQYQAKKRKRGEKKKATKVIERQTNLAELRILQKNLVFVVGLPPRLTNPEILKKPEFFGKYGQVERIVINPNTRYMGTQSQTAAVYVTYTHADDALKAIQCTNNLDIDGWLIRSNLGLTKYCHHFVRNEQCVKKDCSFLHSLAATELTFTKEDIHQKKHYEIEKKFHEILEAETRASENYLDQPKKCNIKTTTHSTQTEDEHIVLDDINRKRESLESSSLTSNIAISEEHSSKISVLEQIEPDKTEVKKGKQKKPKKKAKKNKQK